MTVTTLQLGDITFADFEVPDSLRGGGSHQFREHRLQGGKLVLDAMGRVEKPLTWAGRFRGPNAQDRCQALDRMRIAGRKHKLTFGAFAFTVVIDDFSWDFRATVEIPYDISCRVVTNDAQPGASRSSAGLGQMIGGDVGAFSGIAGRLGIPQLQAQAGGISGIVSSVRNFATASRDTLNRVVAPIRAAQDTVTDLLEATEETLGSFTQLAGVIPGVDPVDMAGRLRATVAAAADASELMNAGHILGRIEVNLTNIGQSGAQVLTAGGDLYRMAADAYDDPTAWDTIARANGLTDPVLDGLQQITVPPAPTSTGGVLR